MELARRERADVMEALRKFFGGDLMDSSWLRAEEFVDDATMVVRVELPGVDPEKDVDISVQNGLLRISAKREEKSEHKEKHTYRSEFRYGSFVREIALPEECQEQDVTAKYADGVLEVRVPMGEAPKPEARRIPVVRG